MAELKAKIKHSSSLPSLCAGLGSLALIIGTVFVAVVLRRSMGIDVAALPEDYDSFGASVSVPAHNARILAAMERLGEGLLAGPEDLAYDAEAGVFYTGCYDGWIKRVRICDEGVAVENWTYVGGRPLGVALTPDKSLVVAVPHRGLMVVKGRDEVEVLTDGAEGIKFGLTDGVDVASDGTVYFSDATYKYNMEMLVMDVLECRSHGRLLSFHPSSGQTVVLARDLYFPNGVCLAPDEESVIVCETMMRRCKRYHIKGEKKGTIETFIENLPGFPDNIRYDGEGRYWIALSVGRSLSWDLFMRFPFLRKLSLVLGDVTALPGFYRDAGVLSVSLEGEPLALYTDPGLAPVTSGIKLGKYLYIAAYDKPYVSRIDLTKHAASATGRT